MAEENKYRLVVAYVGTRYQGWQRQIQSGEEATSVQYELEKACKTITGEAQVIGSGRTDSGVHARRQTALLTCETKLPPEILHKAINAQLPADIRVLSLVRAEPNFHPQRSATAKTYRYFILNNKVPHRHTNWPFLRGYTWFVVHPLDLASMRACLSQIRGEHDFRAFQNRGTPVKSTVRRLLEAELIAHESPTKTDFPWELPPELDLQLLEVRLRGTGFLKQMVRNIVGTLVEVGAGKITPEEFGEILAARDRSLSGVTAPARGLFLDSVEYD